MTEQDLATIDRLIKPPSPPERIHGWLDTQLSIARFYGGCTFEGVRYVIDYESEGHPLVRADILEAEARSKKLSLKAERAKEKMRSIQAQGVLA